MNNLAGKVVSENDLKILDIISAHGSVSQRELATRSGLSLGMVNIVLRRLAKTGFIKMTELDGRRIQYAVTRKGFVEKSRRMYDYVARTIRVYREYSGCLESLIDGHVKDGHDRFLVVGEGDLAVLTQLTLKEKFPRSRFETASTPAGAPPDAVVLDCRSSENGRLEGISVLETILKRQSHQRGESHELV